jgi:hypothetical protein
MPRQSRAQREHQPGGVAAMVLNGLRAFVDGRPMKNPLFGDEGRAWFADKQRARVLKVKGLFE